MDDGWRDASRVYHQVIKGRPGGVEWSLDNVMSPPLWGEGSRICESGGGGDPLSVGRMLDGGSVRSDQGCAGSRVCKCWTVQECCMAFVMGDVSRALGALYF